MLVIYRYKKKSYFLVKYEILYKTCLFRGEMYRVVILITTAYLESVSVIHEKNLFPESLYIVSSEVDKIITSK